MRILFRYGSAISAQPLPDIVLKRPSLVSIRSQWTSKAWICQQCYSQRLFNYETGYLSELTDERLQLSRRKYNYRNHFYKQSRALSSVSQDGPAKQRSDLPSQEEGRRSHLSKRFSHVMDHLQSNIFIAGQRLNDLTGYSGIEALKKDIEQQESLVQTTRSSLSKAREDYSSAIAQRSASQREVNELLQRKHAWTPNDLERFTALYRSDHANEQAETAAQERLVAIERQAEEAGAKLSASILARYHEEQIWSDKIRRMSTWGTWGLMGVNVLLFLVFQIGVEPWRRRRLVKGFEDKVMEALEREGSAGAALAEMQVAKNIQPVTGDRIEDAQISAAEEILPESQVSIQEEVPKGIEADAARLDIEVIEPPEPMSTLQRARARFQDIFSERQVMIRRVDLTTAMMEGAAAGVAFVGLIALLLRPR